MKGLVSIVSPCYNGESYIDRFLNCIIAQDYRPIKLILVNDGSTDDTDNIINSYKKKLDEAGIVFEYLRQENQGVGFAVNNGLKYIDGEYLALMDSDDIIYPDSVTKRVEFLRNNKEYGYVYSDGYSNKNGNLVKVNADIPSDGNMFLKFLDGNVVYNPNGYMMRISAFIDVCKDKSIYPSRYGQNIQMFLPISHKYKCGYLEAFTYERYMSDVSLSKCSWGQKNYEDLYNRAVGYEDMYVNTLRKIGGQALVFIPLITLRTLRSMNVLTRKYKCDEHKEWRNNLIKAVKLMAKELLKALVEIIKG